MIDLKLKGKVAIVTGAAAGIGEATAILFAKEGASVCCVDLTENGLVVSKKIRDSGGKAEFIKGDISKPEDAERIIEKTVSAYGRIDILFNNAGIVLPSPPGACLRGSGSAGCHPPNELLEHRSFRQLLRSKRAMCR
jgi:NAD(P)-dependent dehydrogenase (short-subunit alcohol dehydrogenase family)